MNPRHVHQVEVHNGIKCVKVRKWNVKKCLFFIVNSNSVQFAMCSEQSLVKIVCLSNDIVVKLGVNRANRTLPVRTTII
jgi:hypothetical protein